MFFHELNTVEISKLKIVYEMRVGEYFLHLFVVYLRLSDIIPKIKSEKAKPTRSAHVSVIVSVLEKKKLD